MSQKTSKVLQFSTGMPDSAKHSVLLVDDQDTFRDIARNQLANDQGFEIVREANDGTSAIEKTDQLRPSVIVMDIQMPDMSGMEAARHILDANPGVRIVLTSMGNDAEYEPLAREIGACGFIPKRELCASNVHALVDDYVPPAESARMSA